MFAHNHFETLFPTGLWVFQLENHEALNQGLSAALYAMMEEGKRKETHFPEDVWQTEDTLHTLPEFEDLAGRIQVAVEGVLDFLAYDYEAVGITGMWGNIYRRENVINEHSHHNNFLSGVYYVAAPENSGGIVFKDPRGQTQVLEPKVREHNQFNAGHAIYPAQEGTLFVFPSWLEHKVQPNRSDRHRISISFNAMFRGELGTHAGLNHLRI